jgi:predicted phage terminase large subunit-like protein
MLSQPLMQSLARSPAATARAKWLASARPAQITPQGDWRTWLVSAGRGFGKTRLGAEDIGWYAATHPEHQIAVVAPTFNDVRGTCFEGVSGLLACIPHEEIAEYNKSLQQITMQNGAIIRGFSADTPNRLRGPQFHRAWCFIAGTKVETINGPVAIERICVGDMVLTRAGFKPVLGNSCRLADVGKVSFVNGQSLVGTRDHPVYTAHGWTRMDRLAAGDKACAINQLNGTGRLGAATTADITKGQLSAKAKGGLRGFIEKLGNIITVKSQTAWRFTTSTKTSLTMTLRTLSFFQSQSICATTGQGSVSRIMIGLPKTQEKSHVKIAGSWFTLLGQVRQFARLVSNAGQMQSAPRTQNASNAGFHLEQFAETTALSVASTWRPVGERPVYCLKVGEQPEYFANGVLVHNCDELAAWQYPDAWDQLMFGLRLGDNPRVIVTTTPRPTPLIRSLVKDTRTRITRGSTFDNADNLAPQAIEALREKYEGTRLGRQELYAEILDDVEGALWTRDTIHITRTMPTMQRVVIGVDPSGGGDEIGIVATGKGIDGRFYVLEDATCSLSPSGWARRVAETYRKHNADRIVAERNFGGDMVESTIRTADRHLPVRMVTASRGKVVRAEPIAALYEQGKISHNAGLEQLEDQMMQFTLQGFVGEGSPDRVDALVWALSDLALGQVAEARTSTVIGLY